MSLGISVNSVPFYQRTMTNLSTGLSESLRRLSSGSRINSAKDDAAGSAISTRFQAQTRGNNAAIRNVHDMLSYMQTADGLVSAITDSLLRLRDLSVQASNDSLSNSERGMLQDEADQLTQDISRTVLTGQYNGMLMLNNSSSRSFQISWEPDDYLTFSATNLITGEIGGLTNQVTSSSQSSGGSASSETEAGSTEGTPAGETGSTGGTGSTSTVTAAQVQLAQDQASAATTFLNAFLKFQKLKAYPLMVHGRDNAEGLYGLDQISGQVRQSGSDIVLDPKTPEQEAVNAVFEAIQSTFNTNIGNKNASSSMVSAAKAATKVFTDAAAAAVAAYAAGNSSSGGGTTTTPTAPSTPITSSTPAISRQGLHSFNSDLTGVLTFDLSDSGSASNVISLVDQDISLLSQVRGVAGGAMVRLSSIVDSLTSSALNMSATNSRIADADFAGETLKLARNKFLTDSVNSIQVQANASTRQVLQLLGGAKTSSYSAFQTQIKPVGSTAIQA